MNSLELIAALFIVFQLSVGLDNSPLSTWTLLDTVLPVANRNQFATWNEDSVYSDCIFLFGGLECTECMYCFNITNDEIYLWDTMKTDSDRRCSAKPGVFWHIDEETNDEYIYYLNPDRVLKRYNLQTKNETIIDDNLGLSACLNKHPNKNEFYVAGDSTDGEFYIYELNNINHVGGGQHIRYQGNSCKYDRRAPSCIINTYTTKPYFYLIGGSMKYIERILLDDNIVTNEWETLISQLSSSIDDRIEDNLSNLDHIGIVTYQNYIYLICGRIYAAYSTTNLIYLDVETMTLSYAGEFPTFIDMFGSVIASNRIYVFGGRYDDPDTGDIGFYDTIYKSNFLHNPTIEPSNYPTFTPSFNPSNQPSNQPSILPTTMPTTDPSNIPSKFPSNIPSPLPSSIPTVKPSHTPSNIPSNIPSGIPSKTPSSIPSDIPSYVPSYIPSNMPSRTPTTIPSNMPSIAPTFEPTGITLDPLEIGSITSTNKHVVTAAEESVKLVGKSSFLSDRDTVYTLISILSIVVIFVCIGCFVLAVCFVRAKMINNAVGNENDLEKRVAKAEEMQKLMLERSQLSTFSPSLKGFGASRNGININRIQSVASVGSAASIPETEIIINEDLDQNNGNNDENNNTNVEELYMSDSGKESNTQGYGQNGNKNELLSAGMIDMPKRGDQLDVNVADVVGATNDMEDSDKEGM